MRGFVRFAKGNEGLGVARACELTSERPSEVLGMNALERELCVHLAWELEKERWELLGELLGG